MKGFVSYEIWKFDQSLTILEYSIIHCDIGNSSNFYLNLYYITMDDCPTVLPDQLNPIQRLAFE